MTKAEKAVRYVIKLNARLIFIALLPTQVSVLAVGFVAASPDRFKIARSDIKIRAGFDAGITDQ